MVDFPFFSVILPTYNRADFINKAINSVIDQTYPDWELIIIDDGSTDQTKNIVEAFNDERIHYIYQINQERSAARNNGLKNAKGRYICFIDSDDYYLANHLQQFYDKLVENEFKDGIYFSETYAEINGKLVESKFNSTSKYNDLEMILISPIGIPRVCISKMILLNNLFDEKIIIGEDTELWTRLINNNIPLFATNQFSQVYLQHDERTYNPVKIDVIKAHVELINKLLKINNSKISNKVKRVILSNNYFMFARAYQHQNKKVKLIQSLILSLIYFPKIRFKEKILMLISVFQNNNI